MADTVAALSPDYLRFRLGYEPETGVFVWRALPSNTKRIGTVAGTTDRKGYRSICIDQTLHKAHRLAWLYVHGVAPVGEIDHINGNKSDNRIANLRDVSVRVNRENRRFHDSDSRIPLLGVSMTRHGKYRATIVVSKRQIHLGCYGSASEAHAAYLKSKRELHEGCTL